jgi:hypothetical protein
LGADIECLDKLVICNLCLIAGDETEDGWAINGPSAPADDGIADLSDEDHKPGWSVVVLRVGPDEEDSVHNWLKDINKI